MQKSSLSAKVGSYGMGPGKNQSKSLEHYGKSTLIIMSIFFFIVLWCMWRWTKDKKSYLHIS